MRPRSDARSGARRVHGHRSLHQREPAGASTRRHVRAVRRQRCAATRSSKPGETELTLAPHLDEVVRSSLTPCRIADARASRRREPARAAPAAGTGGTGGGAAGTGGMGGTGGMAPAGRVVPPAPEAAPARRGGGGRPAAAGARGPAAPTATDDCLDPTDSTHTRSSSASSVATGEPRCLNPLREEPGLPPRARLPSDLRADGLPADCASDGVCERAGWLMCHVRPGTTMDDRRRRPATTCNRETVMSCRARRASTASASSRASARTARRSPRDQCFPQLTSYQVNVNAGFLGHRHAGRLVRRRYRRRTRRPEWPCRAARSEPRPAPGVAHPAAAVPRPGPHVHRVRPTGRRRCSRPGPRSTTAAQRRRLLHRSLRSGARSRPTRRRREARRYVAHRADDRPRVRRRRSWSSG